jgi:CubicO group peptidase (beta-lactamase class C family)
MLNHANVRPPVIIALSVLALAAGPAGASSPPEPCWDAASPEEVGISSGALADMFVRIRDEEIEIHSMVIVKDGRLVLEAYVHPYDRSIPHNVKSVSKSVISALTGIALREGVIGSLEETVYEHFPQYITDEMDPRKREINLRHLLTMTSGLDLDENGPISGRIFRTLDWLKATYEQPMVHDPGTSFLYSTPLTHTMSGIITESSGMSLHEFAERHLFGPLGFGEVQWRKGPLGYNFGGAELFMLPLDMARFGYLFLKGGVWEGRQIVPADWVEESTTNKLAGISGRPYGYWWWLDDNGWYHASGWGGQSISICEDLDVVIAVTASDRQASYDLFIEFVEPWLVSEEALGPDPESAERLARVLEEVAHPAPEPPAYMPALAGEIAGRRYVMEWNEMGTESVTFTFRNDDTCLLRLETTMGDYDLVAGLDGVYRLNDVDVGGMPEGNRRALKAYWAEENTLHVSSREVGNPVYSETDFVFSGDEVDATVRILPVGREIRADGKAE